MYRVREEIDEVVGDKTSVEADDLDKLTYMNQVFISCKFRLTCTCIPVVLNSKAPPMHTFPM